MLVKNMKHVGLIVRLEGGMQARHGTPPKEVAEIAIAALANRMLCYFWRVESVLLVPVHVVRWLPQDVVVCCNTMGCAVRRRSARRQCIVESAGRLRLRRVVTAAPRKQCCIPSHTIASFHRIPSHTLRWHARTVPRRAALGWPGGTKYAE